MKIVKLLFVGIILMACDRLPDIRSNARMAYHFDEPATLWEESFPLGNGRIGLMPDGGIEKENIVLNEISMWSGSISISLRWAYCRALSLRYSLFGSSDV